MKPLSIERSFFHWLAVIMVTLGCIAAKDQWGWLIEYPDALIFPFSDWLNVIMDWMVKHFGWFFMGISWVLEWPIWAVQKILNELPWAVTMFLFCLVAFVASGWRLAAFTLGATLYMVVIGYWEESMNSLSLVAISVPLAIFVGFSVGVWGFYSDRAERAIMPALDLFQTVPAFAYLLPILLLFGFGTVVGLIASVLYSFPPMVRNTIIGLRSVAPEVIESGLMSGATPGQLFWQVRVPSCRKQLLLGVNQATMASLSMVIIMAFLSSKNTPPVACDMYNRLPGSLTQPQELCGASFVPTRTMWQGMSLRDMVINSESYSCAIGSSMTPSVNKMMTGQQSGWSLSIVSKEALSVSARTELAAAAL